MFGRGAAALSVGRWAPQLKVVVTRPLMSATPSMVVAKRELLPASWCGGGLERLWNLGAELDRQLSRGGGGRGQPGCAGKCWWRMVADSRARRVDWDERGEILEESES